MIIRAIAHDFRTVGGQLFTPLLPERFGLELWGSFVTERLMKALTIVECFNVLEHAQPS